MSQGLAILDNCINASYQALKRLFEMEAWFSTLDYQVPCRGKTLKIFFYLEIISNLQKSHENSNEEHPVLHIGNILPYLLCHLLSYKHTYRLIYDMDMYMSVCVFVGIHFFFFLRTM